MTAIGPGHAAVGMAGSLANSQRGDSAAAKGDSAVEAAHHAQRAGELRISSDVAESEMSPERDADGRMPWTGSGEATSDGSSSGNDSSARPKPGDPTGQRGTKLDVSA